MTGAAAEPGPWLDIVVPYAGPADLLRETVGSVLAQTAGGWRLTVVEDGPQDAMVGPWLSSLGDPRVHHRAHPRTLGVAANFQHCLELASLPRVLVLGCDDRLHPRYVEVVAEALSAHPDATVVHPGVRVIDAAGSPRRPLGDRVKARLAPRGDSMRLLAGEPALVSLMRGNWAYFPAMCWRRADVVVPGFRQDLATVLDLELLARLLLDGGTLLWVPEVAFDYRRHAASASSLAARSSDRFAEERLVSREIAERAAASGWTSAARAARLRLTSRLHAALLVPRMLGAGDGRAAAQALSHTVGR